MCLKMTLVVIQAYSHPAVDRIWGIKGTYSGSVKDHILSTPGWLYIYVESCRRFWAFHVMSPQAKTPCALAMKTSAPRVEVSCPSVWSPESALRHRVESLHVSNKEWEPDYSDHGTARPDWVVTAGDVIKKQLGN